MRAQQADGWRRRCVLGGLTVAGAAGLLGRPPGPVAAPSTPVTAQITGMESHAPPLARPGDDHVASTAHFTLHSHPWVNLHHLLYQWVQHAAAGSRPRWPPSTDAIPEAHDAVLVATIVHCFAADRVVHLLRRVRAHVPARARLLVVDFWTDPTHTAPLYAALMAGEFPLTPGGGDVYSLAEATGWLAQTGWRAVAHQPLAGPASLLVAEAA